MGNLRLTIYLFLGLVLISSVNALVCDYDAQPFIHEKIDFICNITDYYTNMNCFSYVQDSDNNIIQLNPVIEYKTEVGAIDEFFYLEDGIVKMYYTDKNLFAGRNYTIFTYCSSTTSSESYNFTVEPTIKDMSSLAHRGAWLGENVNYFAYFLVLIVFILVVVYIIKTWGD